jgi:hypothetical protein
VDYFRYFPTVDYDGVLTRNLLTRADLAQDIVYRYGIFYPYRIRDHERADTIAHDYYGDSRYFWLVLAANDVLDPYHDWPLDDEDFLQYVRAKYGTVEYAQATVHHYENPDEDYWMTPETRAALPPEERLGFDVEKTVWQWEWDRNDDKKSIKLLSRRYAARAHADFTESFGSDRE